VAWQEEVLVLLALLVMLPPLPLLAPACCDEIMR
jgi:hypothetical protein